ncbi:phage virion morphogenesis protein [Actinobacillus delphinicola]|uniref:Mu-like prophage protein gpG n=1 Tax=Actinobacillus delphinicola TaxID=51161 RepID=A0A448TUY1_9PAST|nr:phage virion morphogenesis protein [Actinobacillus delphinicola]VEJ09741.1 Mu-like prophage protein gpG [Actinobacillus delphinicola]
MIEIDTNIQALQQVLNNAVHQLNDTTPLMKMLAGELQSKVAENFAQEGRPAWLPLKYRKGKILRDSGTLEKSIRTAYSRHHAEVGTNEKYAPVHQFGTKNAGRNHNTIIPARPFLSLTLQDENELLDDVGDYLRRILIKNVDV